MSVVTLRNSTRLANEELLELVACAVRGWSTGELFVWVRYSRGADFSGACIYRTQRIYVNLGQYVVYPYRLRTYIARSRTFGRRWVKPLYSLLIPSPQQLFLFVFLHELYHLLVKRTRRNTRQKESMCDRFAARQLVDRFGVEVRSSRSQPVDRAVWDFQDLDRFVAGARLASPDASPTVRLDNHRSEADKPAAAARTCAARSTPRLAGPKRAARSIHPRPRVADVQGLLFPV